MTTDPRPTLARSILLSLVYLVTGLMVLVVSISGNRPWTGILTFLAVTYLFQVHVCRDSWKRLGLRFNHRGIVEWLAGCIFGASILSLTVGLIAAPGYLHIRHGDREAVGEAVVAIAALALIEEMIFRGVPLRLLARSTGPKPAILSTSIVFTLAHASPDTPMAGYAVTFLSGCILGTMVLRWKSLTAAWGWHLAWNGIEGIVLGLPISGAPVVAIAGSPLFVVVADGPAWWTGGRYGPEASLPAVILLGATAWWLTRRIE